MRTKLMSWSRAVTVTSDDGLDGQSMVEYALMLVLVALACIAAVSLLGEQVISLWTDISTYVTGTLSSR